MVNYTTQESLEPLLNTSSIELECRPGSLNEFGLSLVNNLLLDDRVQLGFAGVKNPSNFPVCEAVECTCVGGMPKRGAACGSVEGIKK